MQEKETGRVILLRGNLSLHAGIHELIAVKTKNVLFKLIPSRGKSFHDINGKMFE